MSSLHYDSDWHGDFRPSGDAKVKAAPDAASPMPSNTSSEPVVFTNLVHSAPKASTRQEGGAIALIGRLFPAELRRLLSFHDEDTQPSLLEMARRVKRSKA